MTHGDWLERMQFPREWMTWRLVPAELAAVQLSGYQPGDEAASSHDRHGAFQWWLRQMPGPEVLVQLARLSWLDPDQGMGGYVRRLIAEQAGIDDQVARALATPFRRE